LPDGRRYSHHPLGPALVFYPGYVLAGRLGAACTVSLLAAFSLAWTLAALGAMGFRSPVVIRMGWVGLLASPLFLYSGLLFAEIPSACVLAFLLWSAAKKRWSWVGLGLGLLPWMHNRNILLMIPVLLVLAFRWNRGGISSKTAGRFSLAFLIPIVLLILYFLNIYGVWTPLGAHHESFSSLFPIERFPINFPGLLLDQEVGLWFYFPIFALLPVGVLLGWKRQGLLFKTVSASVLFYFFAMCFYQNLGLQPAARYFAPMVPWMLVAMAPAFQALDRVPVFWKRLVGFLWVVTALLSYCFAAVPWMRYGKLQGEAWILVIARKFTGLPWPQWEPSFHAPILEPRSFALSAFWMAVVAFLSWRFLVDARFFRGRK
jgi:hypothetical protein